MISAQQPRQAQAAFLALPGTGFRVTGAMPGPQRAAGLGGRGDRAGPTASRLGATFEGEFSRNLASYAGKGTVSYEW